MCRVKGTYREPLYFVLNFALNKTALKNYYGKEEGQGCRAREIKNFRSPKPPTLKKLWWPNFSKKIFLRKVLWGSVFVYDNYYMNVVM